MQLTDDIEKINQEVNSLAVILEQPESASGKKPNTNKEKKEEKISVQLIKNQALIGCQEILFSFDNNKTKNNEFKKWITFNLSNNNTNTNGNVNVINNANSNAASAKAKDGKRGSLTGISLLNFSEFVKIFVSISKIDEESKQKFLLQQKINTKEDHVELTNNQKAEDTKVYINIQENEENNAETQINNNINDNQNNKSSAIKALEGAIVHEKESADLNKDNKTNSANAKDKKGKNRSNLKQFSNTLLTEGNEDEAKDKKLKDSAKSKIIL